jgi:hypothetical protein
MGGVMRALLLLFVFSLNCWASDNPPPTPRESAGKPEEKATQSNKDAKTKEDAAKELSLLFDNLAALKSEYNAHTSRENEKAKTHYEAMVGYGTIALAVFTGFLMLFTYKLWGATSGLVIEGRDTARKQLRAYIGLEKITFRVNQQYIVGWQNAVSYFNIVDLSFKNLGNTKAERTSVYFNHEVPRPSGALEYMGPFEGQQIIQPGMTITVAPISPAYVSLFWYWGFVVYCDIYQQWWRLNFCYVHRGYNVFAPVGASNYEGGPYKSEQQAIDDNPTTAIMTTEAIEEAIKRTEVRT